MLLCLEKYLFLLHYIVCSLDVYKRQALDKDERNEMKEYQKLADIYTPVSYTHLDVYKRQRYEPARR